MRNFVFKIKAEVWIYPGNVPWHFVTVGEVEAKKIKELQGSSRRGFGSVPVEVTVGKTTWSTSVFPSKDGTYLLPIKIAVRKAEGIFDGDIISLRIKLV